MKITLPDFKQASILVIGDVMLDRYWYGATNRISPEAPVPVVKVEMKEERPGGAANVAMNIAALGANIRLVGLTGVDDAAEVLTEKLNQANVCCDFVTLATHPTITKLRILSHNQQLIRLDFEEGFAGVDINPLLDRIRQALCSFLRMSGHKLYRCLLLYTNPGSLRELPDYRGSTSQRKCFRQILFSAVVYLLHRQV